MSLFKTDTVADAYKNKKKEVKAKIKEIKRLADPKKRIERLEALKTNLRQNGFYDDSLFYKKQRYLFGRQDDRSFYTLTGSMIGIGVGLFAAITVAAVTGSGLAALALFGLGPVVGAVAGTIRGEAVDKDSQYLRREHRKDHGTLRNHRRVVDMRSILDRQMNKAQRRLDNATLINKFSQFAKKCTGKSTAPTPSRKGGKYGIMLLP